MTVWGVLITKVSTALDNFKVVRKTRVSLLLTYYELS